MHYNKELRQHKMQWTKSLSRQGDCLPASFTKIKKLDKQLEQVTLMFLPKNFKFLLLSLHVYVFLFFRLFKVLINEKIVSLQSLAWRGCLTSPSTCNIIERNIKVSQVYCLVLDQDLLFTCSKESNMDIKSIWRSFLLHLSSNIPSTKFFKPFFQITKCFSSYSLQP